MNLLKLMAVAGLLLGLTACNQEKKPMENTNDYHAIDSVNMDLSVLPGNDFFRYANGGWMDGNPIPDEYSRYGAFEVLDKLNKDRLKALVDEVSLKADAPKGSPAQQIRDFYNAAMDTVLIEKMGISPIKPMLEEIEKMTTKEEIPAMIAMLNLKGIYPAFVMFGSQDEKNSSRIIANFMQGGLSLPDRDYYTSEEPHIIEIRKNFQEYVKNMLALSGFENDQAIALAQTILDMETQMAKASMTLLQRRDPNAVYHLLTTNELQKTAPAFLFQKYFETLEISDLKEVNVHQPEFFKEMNKMMKDRSLDEWKTYLSWHLIDGSATLLSSNFDQLHFDFYGKKLSGTQKMQERWKRIIGSINGNLGEALGKLYVEKYFPQEAKDRMLELVSNLKSALHESIRNLDWMSEPTKEKALEKLATMRVKVGYPNQWIDYSGIDISDTNHLQNVWNCNAFNYRDNLNKIGKPVDREEWGMTPQTVNAYYSPNMNEIVFPAAILQPPFFDINADDAVNYGAIGVVIGHEMTHGFDDQGRLYDKDGNLNDWWSEEDAQRFKEKTQILVNQYNEYVMLDSMHIDGNLTLGENIADNGGLFVAYAALKQSFQKNGEPANVDGFTYDQRFLISYAQIWRQNIREKELMRRLKEDVHSPGEARVNAGVANLPWWYSAFNITPDNEFFIKPEERAKIW
ncbi:MAG: M13 family metallopeptidase [Bacteroidales bacterium]|nr:M13 family metallopeptidase [Bacteroidales bacterium]